MRSIPGGVFPNLDPSTTLKSVHRVALIHRVAFFLIKVSSPQSQIRLSIESEMAKRLLFYPKFNILCQFCLQKNNDRFVTYPKPWGGLYYNPYSDSPKMGWVTKMTKNVEPPLPLGASASLTWNEDACALWAASHPPFEGEKVQFCGHPKLLGKTFPNIVMLIRRGAFYKYNICICIYHTKK